MSDVLIYVWSILLYLFEGCCLRFLFQSFTKPRFFSMQDCRWMPVVFWGMIKVTGGLLFHDMNSVALIGKLLFSSIALFFFAVCWYQGNCLLKIFLTIQFISLHELIFLAGYSLLYIAGKLIDMLIEKTEGGGIQIEHLPVLTDAVSCFFVVLMGIIQGVLLYVSIWKIVKSYRFRLKERMGREILFYLLPSVAGILTSVLVRLLLVVFEDGSPILLYQRYPVLHLIIPMIAIVLLLSIVFGFQLYQEMTGLQEERAERIILENQIVQMQNSMVEMEHLYDGIRSVRHDMKNQMMVLQELIQKKYRSVNEEDLEIRHYFEDMCQSVGQLDDRVHTGNAVSDAVINSKFRFAEKEMQGIRLDADEFMLMDAITIKSYDIGIILNNGLDNAIEACLKMRRKQPDSAAFISIRSFFAQNMYFIEIENSFDDAILLDQDSGFPISTKEDKEVHGIGLRNIKKCAVKYGGDMDCIVKGNKFILSIMLKG